MLGFKSDVCGSERRSLAGEREGREWYGSGSPRPGEPWKGLEQDTTTQ